MPNKQSWLFIGGGLVIGAAISGLIGYALWIKADTQSKKSFTEYKAVQNTSYKSLQDAYNKLSQQIQTPPPAPEPTPNYNQPTSIAESDIIWNDKPTLLKSDLVDYYIKNSLPNTSAYAPVKETETIIIGKLSNKNSMYPGWSVLRAHAYDEYEMMPWPVYKTFALSPNKQIILPLNDDLPALSEQDFPKQLTLPNGNIVKRSNSLTLNEDSNCLEFSAIGESAVYKSFVTSKEGIKLYSFGSVSSAGPATASAFDRFGRGAIYYDNFDEGLLRNIQWSVSNSSTLQYYTDPVFSSGCGGGSSTVTSEQLGSLKTVGTFANGEKIYAPVDMENNFLAKQRYDQWFPDYSDVDNKPSLHEYLKLYPVPFFVRKNSFGAWLAYVSDKSGSVAECGKPVIYLYPEKETNISVRLPSTINVTVSEPTYPRNGWNVLAKPDGSLSYKDGKTYGSLFWEGTGVSYTTPKQGFIVKDGDVTSFLNTTLPKYGLNPTETKEFMDFWVPKFHGAPYYRISFLTSDWSKAAPLNVSPAPQTQIRIFMDWSPLAEKISITEPTITTPKRNGFTLVEWGGLLRK